jgi:hypothetical protein
LFFLLRRHSTDGSVSVADACKHLLISASSVFIGVLAEQALLQSRNKESVRFVELFNVVEINENITKLVL